MLQDFDATTRPGDGPPRIAALREVMARAELTGFLVPRADAHQGEYVATCDARLAWLAGFTGSAGFCVVLADLAGLFVDGRYRVQARAQTDADTFAIVPWPDTSLAEWLKTHAGSGARIGFDPWLHSIAEIDRLRRDLDGSGIELVESANLVDTVWADRPPPPKGIARPHPDALAGKSAADKRRETADALVAAGDSAAVLTLPDSISWLLNIRGSDVPRVPVVHCFAILHADASVDLYVAAAKIADLGDHLGPGVRAAPPDRLATDLSRMTGQVRIDRDSAPLAVLRALEDARAETRFDSDPCVLPKACKTPAEIAGAEGAHLRDGAAMAAFLCWLDTEVAKRSTAPERRLTEIDVARALEGFRQATGQLRDISFDTIAGSGPNAAIVHYRVTEATNRELGQNEFLLVDSGGQYDDGTTDITRTVALGMPDIAARRAFTRVLQGVIAVSRARFPRAATGRDIDTLARYPLWLAGQDYDHGTGHGVGSYLSVHEGPQRLARSATDPLQPGMILSNEPGYYREGAFGIRIENLVLVEDAPDLPAADAREMLCFRTLTYVPIDRRGIVPSMLSTSERDWLDAYHRETRARLAPLVDDEVRAWLDAATAPL